MAFLALISTLSAGINPKKPEIASLMSFDPLIFSEMKELISNVEVGAFLEEEMILFSEVVKLVERCHDPQLADLCLQVEFNLQSSHYARLEFFGPF